MPQAGSTVARPHRALLCREYQWPALLQVLLLHKSGKVHREML